MDDDSGITEVIEREFAKLIKAQLQVNSHLEKIVEDHENRLRNLERYAFGMMGAYGLIMTLINVWKEFK